MTRKPARGLPIGPILAILGGGIGVASLLMPWFVFNTAGINDAIQHINTSVFAKDQVTQGNLVNNLQSTMRAGVLQVSPQYVDHLKGYQVLVQSHTAFVAQAAAAGLAIFVGFLGLIGVLHKRGLILFACSIALFARPFYALVMPPAAKTLEPLGFEHAHLLNPTLGFWLSIVAGTVVLASTFGMTARAAVQYDVPVGKYGDTGPFVPQLDTSAASQPAAYTSGAKGGGSYGSQPFVPGVGGAMNSSAPNFGSTPAVYGADPVRPASPSTGRGIPGGMPGAGGGQRSTPPPKF